MLGTATTAMASPKLWIPRAFQSEPPVAAHPSFEKVPASASGITWRHVNGRSPEYSLPEATVAGSACAEWFGYDNDGCMDLFVCRFVDFDKSKNKFCGNEQTKTRFYCIPRVYPPAASWLFHNNGDGTFKDVSRESGIAQALGKAWGVVATDVNNDGWMDLFVANDTVSNFLFINRHNGKFEEQGLEAGVAYSQDGRARSGMGVDAADFSQHG